jgi:hypothetical protein
MDGWWYPHVFLGCPAFLLVAGIYCLTNFGMCASFIHNKCSVCLCL